MLLNIDMASYSVKVEMTTIGPRIFPLQIIKPDAGSAKIVGGIQQP